MDPNTRLRIATRIHFALLRHLGDSVEVQDILHRPSQTREVLWVCDGSGDDEMIALAAQFRQASRPEAPATGTAAPAAPAPTAAAGSATRRRNRNGGAPQDTSWGRDTSGFGVSHPPELHAGKPSGETPKPDRDWFKPSTWLRTR